MDVKFRLGTILTLALLLFVSISPLWLMPVSAMTSEGLTQVDRMQPPPEAPSEPPPGAGPEEGPPSEPSEPPSEPYEPPSDPDTPTSEEEAVDEPPPPMPSYAPSQAEPLPEPSGESGGGGGEYYQVQAFSGLTVSVDRGCGATYNEGDSIDFSATGDWEVFDVNTDWWRYLEVWGSTNGAWWHQVISGRWVEPRDSVHRRGWIAAPVGDELLYARFLDRYGNVLAEANCYYTSQTKYDPPPPSGSWIECGDTVSGYVGPGQEEEWLFPGDARRRVTISMGGYDGFDTYLELYDPDNRFLREHDDISSSNRNSRIRVTLGYSGVYTIVAHGYDYQEGSYSLSVNCR
jgi:hypothetical protein